MGPDGGPETIFSACFYVANAGDGGPVIALNLSFHDGALRAPHLPQAAGTRRLPAEGQSVVANLPDGRGSTFLDPQITAGSALVAAGRTASGSLAKPGAVMIFLGGSSSPGVGPGAIKPSRAILRCCPPPFGDVGINW